MENPTNSVPSPAAPTQVSGSGQQPRPPVPSKKSAGKTWAMVVLAVLVLAIIAGAYFFTRFGTDIFEPNSLTVQPTVTPTALYTPPAGWSKLTNENIGMTLYYPDHDKSPVDQLFATPATPNGIIGYHFEVHTYPADSKDLDAWFADFQKTSMSAPGIFRRFESQGHTTVGGNDAIKAKGWDETAGGSESATSTFSYFVAANSQIYYISLIDPAPDYEQLIKSVSFFQPVNPDGQDVDGGNVYGSSFDGPIIEPDFWIATYGENLDLVTGDAQDTYYVVPIEVTNEIYQAGLPVAITNPKDPDTIFLVNYDTTGYDSATFVYSYNLKTGTLVRVYSKVPDASSDDYAPVYYLLGQTGSKLILEKTVYGDSAGPCANLWNGTLVQLDLANVAASFQPYTPPADFVQKKETESEKCQSELGN